MNLQKTKILRTLSKGVLVLTGLFLLGFLGWTVYRGVKFRPYKVRVTNVTDSAFTVSWVTDSPMPGIVYYGEKDSFLPGPLAWLGKRKAVDDRDFSDAQSECVSRFNENASKNKDENFTVDVSGFDCNDIKVWKYGKYYTHHVTVQNLDAEKEYFFRVGDGLISYAKGKTEGVVYVEREIPEIENFQQKTLPVITKIETPNPAYGTSYNVYYREDGTMGEKKNFDSLVFLTTFKNGEKYPILSSVTNKEGGWTLDLANVRKGDGSVVSMDGASLEFIPQVENAKPGAAGSSFFEEIEFPLNIMGNSEDDWGKSEKALSSSNIKSSFVKNFPSLALSKYIGVVSAARTCYKCEGGVIKSNTSGDGVPCPTGYSLSKPTNCSTTPPATKSCCKISNNTCSCVSRTTCGGDYPYVGLDACREKLTPTTIVYKNINWGEPCVNTSNKCKCPDATIINIGSSCSTPKINWGEMCKTAKCLCPDTKTITSGNSCSEEPIEKCNDLKNMIIGGPVRGGCQNGNNYCYLPYYHKNANGSQGELCQYVKTTGAACGSIYCGDDKVLEIGDKWTGGGKAVCTSGSGCRCLDGSIAKLNTTCEGKESKVDCYMYSNLKGCYLAFKTGGDNCITQGGVVGEEACKSNFVCTQVGVGTLKDFINMCDYNGGCSCPQGSVSSRINCGDKCFRKEESTPVISDPAVLCAIFNTDTRQCESVTNKNWCNDYKSYLQGSYYSDSAQCLLHNPKAASVQPTNSEKCYDSKNFALIDCKNCGGTCIRGDNALLQAVNDKEKKGYVLVPLQFANNIVQVYIKNDDYQNWLSSCISGESPSVDYAYVSSPDKSYTGIPSCPKVDFEFIPGKQLGDKAIYNYDTLDKIWNFLGIGAGAAALTKLLVASAAPGAATVTTTAALSTMGTAAASVTAPMVTSASSILASELAAANVVMTPSLFNAVTAKIATALASNGGIAAAKTLAWQFAQTAAANFGTASAGTALATTGTTALATTGTTALATTGGSTALTTTGAVAGTAGGISAGAVVGGVAAVAVVALGVDALTHLEGVYEQCSTIVNGVVTYSIQQKYCSRTRDGVKWESTLCECNGVRTELKNSNTPVFEINYYLKADKTFEACAGGKCMNDGIKINPNSRSPIEINGQSMACCGGVKPVSECCLGVSQYLANQYCGGEWGQCVKIDKVSVSGLLLDSLKKDEIAYLKKDLGSVASDKFVKGLFAAEEENEQKFLYSDSGLYEVSFIGGEKNFVLKDGDTTFFYYLERNGIIGYQAPENPFEPKENEDLAVTESSVIISAERRSTLQTVNLKKGINIISFNYVPTLGEEGGKLTSDSFLKIANKDGENVSRISFFMAGQWNGGTVFDFERKETKGVPFELVVGRGYVVVANQDCNIQVPSYELKSSVPLALSSGWNLVGVNGYSTAYTAKTFIESINTIEGLKANNVSWWPTSRGMYQGYQLQNGQEYGQDFPISPLNGYFVRIGEFTPKESTCKSLIWNPSGEKNGECGSSN